MHHSSKLLDRARTNGIEVTPGIVDADLLMDLASISRYPVLGKIECSDYDEGVAAATAIVKRAEPRIAD